MYKQTRHYPDDGRGARNVYLDGNLVSRVVFADERKGIVEFCQEPLALVGKGLHTRVATVRKRGKVTIEWLEVGHGPA